MEEGVSNGLYYQKTEGLVNDLGDALLFSSELFSDITFLVGESEVPVPAHKVILCSRSKRFKALVLASESDMEEDGGMELKIPNCGVAEFKKFLRFLYTGTIEFTYNTSETVDLLSLACDYTVGDLIEVCCLQLKRNLGKSNVSLVLNAAFKYNLPELRRSSLEFVLERGEEVFQHVVSIQNFSKEVVIEIISSDTLRAEEETVFEFAVRWGIQQCGVSADFTSVHNCSNEDKTKLRDFLSDVFAHVRFALLSVDYLYGVVQPMGIVPEVYIMNALFQITGEACVPYDRKVKRRNLGEDQQEKFRRSMISCTYEYDFDQNGVFFQIGSNSGRSTWRNPAYEDLVLVTSPKSYHDCDPKELLSRSGYNFFTNNTPGASVTFELRDYRLVLRRYTLQHGSWATHQLRNWELRASNDGVRWTTLCVHENDPSLPSQSPSATHTFTVSDHSPVFSTRSPAKPLDQKQAKSYSEGNGNISESEMEYKKSRRMFGWGDLSIDKILTLGKKTEKKERRSSFNKDKEEQSEPTSPLQSQYGSDEAFSYFMVMQTGLNAEGNNILCLGGIELYGKLLRKK